MPGGLWAMVGFRWLPLVIQGEDLRAALFVGLSNGWDGSTP